MGGLCYLPGGLRLTTWDHAQLLCRRIGDHYWMRADCECSSRRRFYGRPNASFDWWALRTSDIRHKVRACSTKTNMRYEESTSVEMFSIETIWYPFQTTTFFTTTMWILGGCATIYSLYSSKARIHQNEESGSHFNYIYNLYKFVPFGSASLYKRLLSFELVQPDVAIDIGSNNF